MLMRIGLSVEGVGEAQEFADLRRARRLGTEIDALIEYVGRTRPGVRSSSM